MATASWAWAAIELNRVREKFAMLFQNAALFDSMTVYENVAFPLEEKTSLSRDEINARVDTALQDVGLKNVQQQISRRAVRRHEKTGRPGPGLLLEPQIVLFDEPTTGLDPVIRRAIHQLIKETQAKFGFTAVIVSHEIPDIFEMAHHVAMLYRGEILQFGTPDEIQELRPSGGATVYQRQSGRPDQQRSGYEP